MAEHEPFDGLSVVLHSSEVPLSDFHGEAYPNAEDLTLKGEKAYELLVQLNRADKECFERKALGCANKRFRRHKKLLPPSEKKRMHIFSRIQRFKKSMRCSHARFIRTLPLLKLFRSAKTTDSSSTRFIQRALKGASCSKASSRPESPKGKLPCEASTYPISNNIKKFLLAR